MECPNCGRKYEGVAVFCPGCGTRLLEGQAVAGVPYEAPVLDENALRHERNIYLMLTLIPLVISIAINVTLVALYIDRKPPVVPVNLIRLYILIPAIGVMIYAVIRLGLFLEFTATEWVFAMLLVLFCSLLSVVYMLLKATSSRVKPKKVGRIYEEEDTRTGHEKGGRRFGRRKSESE